MIDSVEPAESNFTNPRRHTPVLLYSAATVDTISAASLAHRADDAHANISVPADRTRIKRPGRRVHGIGVATEWAGV